MAKAKRKPGAGRPVEFGERENHVLWLPKALWDKIVPEKFGEKSKNGFIVAAIQEKLNSNKEKQKVTSE
jgi:hypothetical protein